ncbi:hypothetical protein J0895_01045 [Phormidium pseudopriestleyi FRX01]|uniref:Uncharacterized protein n=1 Tax=Phormidium pseudopriestleyi FRX01 TaxID=1759528 RepID=A0ABS3FKT6_9CYAN|nr:hypothetical protein [Phormidium pseudopriestleyi]MBO0347716.1 hypothetical protein [Phormidium pseudopriestleyi FRX01]
MSSMVFTGTPRAIASGQRGPSTSISFFYNPLDNFLPTVTGRLFYGMNCLGFGRSRHRATHPR